MPQSSPPSARPTYGNGSTAIRPRRTSLTGRALVLAIVMVVLGLSFAYPLRGWFDQRAQLSALQEQTISQQRKIAELQSDLSRWEDPAFVETQARDRLRFVMPGEASFVVLGGDTEDEEVARAAAELAATGAVAPSGASAWWERLWSTVDQADAAVLPEPTSPVTGASSAPTDSATPGATDATQPAATADSGG